MHLARIFAHLSCTNLDSGKAWYEKLFGRAPDAFPMEGLIEWHHGSQAGFQLFRNPANAGKGNMTLIVPDLEAEYARLRDPLNQRSAIETGDAVQFWQLSDPDGNQVVLAQPKA